MSHWSCSRVLSLRASFYLGEFSLRNITKNANKILTALMRFTSLSPIITMHIRNPVEEKMEKMLSLHTEHKIRKNICLSNIIIKNKDLFLFFYDKCVHKIYLQNLTTYLPIITSFLWSSFLLYVVFRKLQCELRKAQTFLALLFFPQSLLKLLWFILDLPYSIYWFVSDKVMVNMVMLFF